ncbi:Cytochrome P450 [Penicillium samsonianum]|uniref:Cytochrome P450 n=1 Tax=Penicillium samsonianum TaxID=1882272 RepID=UPI002547855F|nr:Cytochrome P450 [Penicillium samsonianum]KAJ6150369.1 Cytochrome P450 [Penicillium samsonianum]
MHIFIYVIVAVIGLSLSFAHCYQFNAFNFSRCWRIIGRKPLFKKRYNRLTPLQSRAIPNQRLRVAFGIDNAFTSHEEFRVKQFIVQAKSLINLSPTAWNLLSDIAHRAVRRSIKDTTANGHGEIKIRVMDLVQALTLRMVLQVLFSMEDEALNLPDSCLIELANAINITWINSKIKTTSTPFENNSHLQEAILGIFPATQDLNPQNNPLNMILPGFETMWRIAICMFIETGYTTGFQHPEWRTQLAAFARTPSKAVFVQKVGIDNVSVEQLVNEALRLYPPTKRVYRAFQCYESSVSEVEAADIEGSHTAAHIWGSGAMFFDPKRWDALTSTQKHAFIPFGKKPFVCPAQSVFGPRVIGLIVGVLLMELGEDWTLKFIGSDGKDLRPETRLSNERNSYDCLYLTHGGNSFAPQGN